MMEWPYSIVFVLGAVALAATGCDRPGPPSPSSVTSASSTDGARLRLQVESFCGDCHKTPLPESFPRKQWQHEVDQGFKFYQVSGRTDLQVPSPVDVLSYYWNKAPNELRLPPPQTEKSDRFQLLEFTSTNQNNQKLAVANILALPVSEKPQGQEFVWCEMRSGEVVWAGLRDQQLQILGTHKLKNPSHICRTDLDADGTPDYLVSDLGSFLPQDHRRGRVVWLRPKAASANLEFDELVLCEDIGRVSDAQPGDFDGDGDLDIIVASFGWYTSGSVLLLTQSKAADGRAKFDSQVLDQRNGAIHVPVADLNADGRSDFVSLFSQEHESVEAFLTQANGTFDKQMLYRAPDPSYGSNGIELVDLDADGDLDVLYTNGDTFDSYLAKPYHAIRWIENRGSDGWTDHLLASLPGVHRAVAGDLDGDGDLDIAACSFISAESQDRQPDVKHYSSIVWLEQKEGNFHLREIEADNPAHACMELADVNRDGAPDLIVGNFGLMGSVSPISIWLNRGQSR